MEREQFLGRVRSALRGAVLPDFGEPSPVPEITFDDPVARFGAMAEAVDAEVLRAGDEAEAVDVVLQSVTSPHLASSERTRSDSPSSPEGRGFYVAWDEVPDALLDGLAAGWERVDASVGVETRSVDHHRIGEATLGITTADVAIAATGSVVLTHGPGRPRSASLLVEHHVVLLPIESIVSSLHEAMERVEWGPSNVVAITGPSRTGDIESILTLGVHGPRHLSLVLIG